MESEIQYLLLNSTQVAALRRHMGCYGEGLAPAGIGKLKEVAAAQAFCSTIVAGNPTVYIKRINISAMNFREYFRYVLYYERR